VYRLIISGVFSLPVTQLGELGWLALLAQEGGGAAGGGAGAGGFDPLSILFPIAITILLMYFILMRPEQKKRKEIEQRLAAIKKNDHVVTIGGIYGTVVATPDPKIVVLRVDDTTGTKLKVLRSAISHVGALDEVGAETKTAE
jgi:preprotein translocase subunit YajC